VVGVGLGIHELYMYHGPTGVWEVSHKLDESEHWAHPPKFDPAKVRLDVFGKDRLLSDEECDFLVNLTKKTHDYNGYATLTGISDDEYLKLETATQKVIKAINRFSGRNDQVDHLALRLTPRKGVRAHADNVHWDKEKGKWVPNGSSHRTWSSSTLLNHPEEFKGGTFRFHEPKRYDLPMKKGDTVIFDSSEKNVHSVDTVPEGGRYTLLVWLHDSTGEHNRKLWW